MWREATHPGQMFGHLVIVKRGPRTKRRQAQWFCRRVCGKLGFRVSLLETTRRCMT
jgi:hypothetical protein